MRALLCLFACLIGYGCAPIPEAADGERRAAAGNLSRANLPLQLETDAERVGTVLLYAGVSELNPPILRMGSDDQLTLAFDLIASEGRPVSVYYYHADRNWDRRLLAVEFIDGFQRTDLTRYDLSQLSEVPFVHYEHQFPPDPNAQDPFERNNLFRFTVSGNYVVRVTEQGREDEVLFERPFFVTEDQVTSRLDVDPVTVTGRSGLSLQPILRLTASPEITAQPFNLDVCFSRNGRYAATRCTDRAQRYDPTALTYLLQPTNAFGTLADTYYLDLRAFDLGTQISQLERAASPPRVILEPDAFAFPSDDLDPLLAGQSRISTARVAGDPDLSAEYAAVTFRFIPPDEEPLGDVYLEGSWSGWHRPAEPMRWIAAERYYEQTMLVKQGEHEYRYVSPNPALERAREGVLGRRAQIVTGFVYFRDQSLQTDRLLSIQAGRASL
jgi:hypothetical protein